MEKQILYIFSAHADEMRETSDKNLMLVLNNEVGIKTHFLIEDNGEWSYHTAEAVPSETQRQWFALGNIIYPSVEYANRLIGTSPSDWVEVTHAYNKNVLVEKLNAL